MIREISTILLNVTVSNPRQPLDTEKTSERHIFIKSITSITKYLDGANA